MKSRKFVCNIAADAEATFIERQNRFLALVQINNNGIITQEKVHVHDPGRLRDILYPGNRVLLKKALNPGRKTVWDMIAGKSGDNWILINSAFHRQISTWVLENGILDFLSNADHMMPEQKYGKSRLDYLLIKGKRKIWVEIKGCTLAEGRVATFPDAPTARGKRHLEELIRAKKDGYDSAVIILVLRPETECFRPNEEIDPLFADTFRRARREDVRIYPLLFTYENGSIYYISQLGICDK